MKKKNIKNIVLIVILGLCLISIFSIKKYSFTVDHEGKLTINNPIIFTIKSKVYGKNKALGSIEINVYNKHNNDVKLNSTLNPYYENIYQFIFIPSAPGEYYFTIKYQENEKNQIIINKNFYVK